MPYQLFACRWTSAPPMPWRSFLPTRRTSSSSQRLSTVPIRNRSGCTRSWAACEAATFTSGSEDSKLHLCGSASHSLSPSKTHPSQGLSEFDKSCTFTLLILLFASSSRSMVGWTWLKVFFQKATKDTIYTITSMNLTANNLTDLMDRIGPSNSTEVQKGAKLEGATHYAQETAQIIAYVSYVLCMFYHLICIYSYMYIICIIWYVHFCIFKCTFCMCTCTYTQICVLFEVRHAIKAKKGVQKAFWLRIQWERCDLAATNVWALLHLGRIDVSESCLKKLTSTRWPCNQGFFKHWSMASVKNDALLKRNLGSTPSYFVHQSVSQNQANQRNQPYTWAFKPMRWTHVASGLTHLLRFVPGYQVMCPTLIIKIYPKISDIWLPRK